MEQTLSRGGAGEAAGASPLPVVYLLDKIGTGGVASHLLQVFRHLDRARFAPLVVCLVGGAAREYDPAGHDGMIAAYRALDVPVEVLHLERVYHPRYLGEYRRLAALLRPRRHGILHMYLFSSILAGTTAALWARMRRRVASRRESGQWWMRPSHHRAMALAHRLHDAVVVNSREIADEIRRLEGVPEARIRLIHNGIDLSRFDRARREPLPAPFPAGEGPAVGMIANLVPVKGHADLLEAFARVRRERSDARLVLVGDGPLRAALEARAGGEDLAGAVHFAGRHPAPPWIDRFDVAVQSSVSEGMSNVLLEYMAAGRPMAVTAVGATPEALEDGVHGRLVPPRDPAALAAAILDLLRDPERAARLGTAARARVEERFTAARMVRRMEDLYDAMVGSLRIG